MAERPRGGNVALNERCRWIFIWPLLRSRRRGDRVCLILLLWIVAKVQVEAETGLKKSLKENQMNFRKIQMAVASIVLSIPVLVYAQTAEAPHIRDIPLGAFG